MFGILIALLSFFTVVSAAAYVLALTAEIEPRERRQLHRPSRHHRAA